MKNITVLVTGASGVVGVEVVGELAARGHAVIAMAHRSPELVRNDGGRIPCEAGAAPAPGRVALLRGDVRDRCLGLGQGEYESLASSIDMIVHSAALTDIGRPWSVYEPINVQGTSNVLELALHRGRNTPFLHVSTAYVSGERQGLIREHELDAGQGFGDGYEQSKLQAELLVRAAMARGLPAAVARPSIVVGALATGCIREFKHLYVVLKLLTEGKVRSIPANYDATLDLVPVDHVARGIAALVERFDRAAGRTFHLVNRRPTMLRDVSDVVAEYPAMHVPRFVPPSSFDKGSLSPIERRMYDWALARFEPYFRRRVEFANDLALELLGDQLPTLPDCKTLLRTQLDHCEAVGYLGRPVPTLDEIEAAVR